MNILIDGDLLVYQATVSSSLWKLLADKSSYFKTKKQAYTYWEQIFKTIPSIKRYEVNPHLASITNQLDSMIKDIVDFCLATGHKLEPVPIVVLNGDGKNFRYGLVKDIPYKQNRSEKPLLYEVGRQYLIDNYTHKLAYGMETDDLITILNRDCNWTNITVSKDKDFRTKPGYLYNPLHRTFEYIRPHDAMFNFYCQMLTGDRADNVPGVRGIGPVKAKKLLLGLVTEADMAQVVLNAYEGNRELMEETGRMLYLIERHHEVWSLDRALNNE